jgi:hypothetical protein
MSHLKTVLISALISAATIAVVFRVSALRKAVANQAS